MPQTRTSRATEIAPEDLTTIRAEAAAQPRSQFVDPRQMRQVQDIVQRRGETWLAAVLGRDLSRRSLISAAFPWLYEGEMHTIQMADVAEDRAIVEAIAACTCVVSCADDPATGCSLSGINHVHPDDGRGIFGPCPVHPDAPGDL